jgi:hypothetical protein
MFRQRPEALDWSIYNDPEHYTNENITQLDFGGYIHQSDLGVLLEITPERVQIVNDQAILLQKSATGKPEGPYEDFTVLATRGRTRGNA